MISGKKFSSWICYGVNSDLGILDLGFGLGYSGVSSDLGILDLDHFLPGKKLIFFNVLLQVKSSHLGS